MNATTASTVSTAARRDEGPASEAARTTPSAR